MAVAAREAEHKKLDFPARPVCGTSLGYGQIREAAPPTPVGPTWIPFYTPSIAKARRSDWIPYRLEREREGLSEECLNENLRIQFIFYFKK